MGIARTCRDRTRRREVLLHRRLPRRSGRSCQFPRAASWLGLMAATFETGRTAKTNFELIVGRSITEDRTPRYLGFVYGYDR